MDISTRHPDDPLASPTRRRLFDALVALRRPATTQELAGRVGRHHNWARVQLAALAGAGLVEQRTVRQARGRPRHEWSIAAGARPGGRAPEAYTQLGRWLARAVGRGGRLEEIEETGREIGRELAPPAGARPPAEAMCDVLATLGFAPKMEGGRSVPLRYVLCNCPYREAVRENQIAVCTLHRGITRGLLERLDPEAQLAAFVPKDPDNAGCLIDVAGASPSPSPPPAAAPR